MINELYTYGHFQMCELYLTTAVLAGDGIGWMPYGYQSYLYHIDFELHETYMDTLFYLEVGSHLNSSTTISVKLTKQEEEFYSAWVFGIPSHSLGDSLLYLKE